MPSIDERVVQMSFDNKQFERGVSESLKTLKDLKQALDFSESEKSLKNIERAFNGVDLSGLTNSLDGIASKFSPLGVLGVTAMQRISNAAIDAGKKVADAFLGISDMSAGKSKYETQTKAVQTITNATGKSVEEVEKVLSKLQKYTDETSYDFAEMVSSIGKFTSVGVELERAERAMEGIASEAAKSGAGKAEANRAMYNFAQALSAGYVKLIDWKSIENANMATKEFKDTLIETAIESGVLQRKGDGVGVMLKQTSKGVKEITVDYKSFNETLSDQWLTSDVLIKTLEKYADTTTDFGLAAYHAAQEALTWTDAIDAVHDAVSSGWMQSFKYIFGDLDEARKMWTDVANALVEYVDIFASWRNEVLKAWHDQGGYNDIIEAASNLWQTFMNIVQGVGKALSDVFPFLQADNMAGILVNGTRQIKEFSEGLLKTFGLYQEIEKKEEEVVDETGKVVEKTTELTEETEKIKLNFDDITKDLKRGMRGDSVRKIQKQLNELGITSEKLVEDGIFGPKTQAGVIELQRLLGVPETGMFDAVTKSALETDGAIAKLQNRAKKGLSLGSKGDEVKKLQKELNTYLDESEKLTVDGIMGPKTEAALKKLQEKIGVEQTGAWDDVTKAAMESGRVMFLNIKKIDKLLKTGDQGDSVRSLQEEINKYLPEADRIIADGIYGPETEAAIKKIQSSLGIQETGFWDRDTIDAIVRQRNAIYKESQAIKEAKENAEEFDEASKKAEEATNRTTPAMMRLQNIAKGFAAAIKIVTKFGTSIVKIGANIASMFSPLIDVVIRFASVLSGMIQNLSDDLDKDNAYGKFVDSVTKAFGPLGTFIEFIANSISGFLDTYDNFLEATGKRNTFGNFFEFIKKGLKENKNIVWLIDLFEKAGSVIGSVAGFISGKIQQLAAWFGSDSFKQGKDNVFSWIADKWTWLIGLFSKDSGTGKQGAVLQWITDGISKLKNVIEDFKAAHPEVTFENFIKKAKEFGKNVKDSLSILFGTEQQSESGSFIDELKERLSSLRPVTDWLIGIKDKIVKIWSDLFHPKQNKEINIAGISYFENLKESLSDFQGIVDWFISIKDKLVSAWDELSNAEKDSSDNSGNKKGFFSGLSEFVKTILEEFDKIDFSKVISTIFKGAAIYGLLNIGFGIKNFGSGVKSFGLSAKTISETFAKNFNEISKDIDLNGISKSIQDRIKHGITKKDTIGTTALKIASSLLIVAGAIGLLSLIDVENLEKVMKPFLIILGSMTTAVILISKLGGNGDGGKQAMMLAGAIGIIAASLWLLANVVASFSLTEIVVALGIVELILITLGVIAVKISKSANGSVGVKGILAMCAGVMVLVLAFGKMANLIAKFINRYDIILSALGIIEALLITLGFISVLTSKNASHDKTGINGILAMCAGVYVLVLAFEKMVKIVESQAMTENNIWDAFKIIEGMLITLGVIAVAMKALSSKGKSKTSGILGLVGALYVIVLAFEKVVKVISSTNADTAKLAFGFIEGFLITIAAASILMSKVGGGLIGGIANAISFLSMAYAVEKIVNVFGEVLVKIKNVNPDVLKWFFIGIDAAMAILGAIVIAFGKMPTAAFIGSAGLLALLGVLAAGIDILSRVGKAALARFSDAIMQIGWAMESFGGSTEGLDFERLKLVAEYLKNTLPGMIKAILRLNLSGSITIMRRVVKIGTNLKAFGNSISTIDATVLTGADNANKLLDKADEMAGKINEITLPNYVQLTSLFLLGNAIYAYGYALSEVKAGNETTIGSLISQTSSLLSLSTDGISIGNVADSLEQLAGALNIYYSALDGVKYDEDGNAIEGPKINGEKLSERIKQLIGAFSDEDIEALTSYGDGKGKSMRDVANGISNLGLALGSYAENIGKLKEEEVNRANGVLDKIKDITYTRSDTENFYEAMAGSQLLTSGSVALSIFAFGLALKSYGENIGTINPTQVDAANRTLDKLMEVKRFVEIQNRPWNVLQAIWMALRKPNESDFTLDAFRESISEIGDALGVYADGIGTFKLGKVALANIVLDKIVDISSKLEVTNWAKSIFWGDRQSLSDFATNINSLGHGLADYANAVSGATFEDTKIDSSLSLIQKLIGLQPNLESSGAVLQKLIEGEKDWSTLGNGLGQLGTDLMTFQNNAQDFDVTKIEGALSTVERLIKAINGVSWYELEKGDLPEFTTSKFDYIVTGVTTLFGNLAKALDEKAINQDVTVAASLSSVGQKIADKIGKSVGEADVSEVNIGISTMLNTVTEAMKANEGITVEEVGKAIIDWIVDGLGDSSKIESLKAEIKSLVRLIVATFGAYKHYFISLGEYMDEGLIEGLRNKANAVARVAEQVAFDAYERARKVVEVASPSKKFIWLGEMMAKGLGVGIQNETNYADKAIESLMNPSKRVGSGGFTDLALSFAENASRSIVENMANSGTINASASKAGAETAKNVSINYANGLKQLNTFENTISEAGNTIARNMIFEVTKGMLSGDSAELATGKAVIGFVQKISGNIGRTITENADKLDASGNAGKSIVDTTVNNVADSLSNSETKSETIKNAAAVFAQNIASDVVEGIKSGNTIEESMKEAGEKVGGSAINGFLQGLIDDRKREISETNKHGFGMSLAYKMTEDIANEMIKGAESSSGPVKATESVGNAMIGAFKNLFGINSPSELFDGYGGYIDEGLANGITSNTDKVLDATDGLNKKVEDRMNEWTQKGYSKEAALSFALAAEQMSKLFGSALAEESSSTEFSDAGTIAVETYANGVTNDSSTLEMAGANAIQAVLQGMKTEMGVGTSDDKFMKIGLMMTEGMKDGLALGENSVAELAGQVAMAAYNQAKAVLGINSPSTEFIWIGEMLGAGLAEGIRSYGDHVASASQDLADSAVANAETSVLALSDVIGFGDGPEQPTIRPVLDLTDIEAGLNNMTQMFTSRTFVAKSSAEAASSIAARENRSVMDDQFSTIDQNTKDLSLAITKLNEKMDTITEEMSNFKIYLNGDVLTGYMTPKIDRNLGANTMLAGRMN